MKFKFIGSGVPKDDAEAVRLYRLAADQGIAAAQNNLGVKYAKGEGVLQDMSQVKAEAFSVFHLPKYTAINQ